LQSIDQCREDLRLVVTLTDNASAQLQRLRNGFSQLSSGTTIFRSQSLSQPGAWLINEVKFSDLIAGAAGF
jgi:hypothetical protein